MLKLHPEAFNKCFDERNVLKISINVFFVVFIFINIVVRLAFFTDFTTKITEYLCSGWFLFIQANFDFFLTELAIFDGIFFVIQKVLMS